MEEYNESRHGERRKRKVMWCIAMDAAPGSSFKLHQEVLVLQDWAWLWYWEAQAGPRYPVYNCSLWKFVLWVSLGSLGTNRSAEKLCRESFAYVQILSERIVERENSLTMLRENSWVLCQVFMSFFTLCGNSSQHGSEWSQVNLCSVLTENRSQYFST